MSSLPKLNRGAVKDKDDKEKKTLKESMRQLSRKASASLKRGLTPRGSRHERQSSFDSLEDAQVCFPCLCLVVFGYCWTQPQSMCLHASARQCGTQLCICAEGCTSEHAPFTLA